MPLSDEILEPIEGENPAGRFLRYDTTDTTYSDIKEAREEEEDLPQGEWKRERKQADWRRVEELATEALETRTKDLQLAAWLAEALTHRRGFQGLADGLRLLRRLLEDFWEHVHPELEDGDAEFRATAPAWADRQLSQVVKKIPLTSYGFDYHAYRMARKVGYEEDAEGDSEKERARQEALAQGKPSAEDFDEAFDGTDKEWYRDLVEGAEAAREELEALAETSQERFGDADPGYRDLREELEDVADVARDLFDRKLEEEPDPPEMDPGADGGGSGGESSQEAGGESGGAEPAAAASGGEGAGGLDADDPGTLVARAARLLRREDPADPGSYLMLRGLRWGEVRAGGDGVDPRLLRAPPTDVRTELKELLLDSRWEELLEAGEQVMATPYGRGWLDLQRYVLSACEGLGGEYDAVAWSIRGALRSLLRDVPELPEATLMDDSPTANRETLAWLREEGVLEDESGEEGEGRRGPSRAEQWSHRGARERARQKLRSGDPDGAIQTLMDYVEQEKSERARFLGRAEAARIMVETDREAVAMPILQDMLDEIEEHNLEDWEEGETVALPLGLLYQCVDKLEGDTPRKEALYERVCRLDPVQAMRFTSRSPPAAAEPAAGPAAEAEETPETADGE